MNLADITGKLTPRGWLGVGAAAAVAGAFVLLVMQMASSPSYTTVQAGLSPSQTGKVTQALTSAGITYQLQANGTAVAVPSGEASQAQVALGNAGITSQPSLLQLIQNQGFSSLGASPTQVLQQQEAVLETQLDGVIEGIQGVTTAQVQIVIPDPTSQLFTNSASQATASVLLDDSGTFDAGSVRGIADLVANAVPGLSAGRVTITDQTGALLWPTSSSGGGGGLPAAQSAQFAYDTQMAQRADAALNAMLGPGLAQVQISAVLNANQQTIQSVAYGPKKGLPLNNSTTHETLNSTGGGTAAGGAITGAAGATGTGTSRYNRTQTGDNLGVDKTVTQTVIAPGQVTPASQNIAISLSSKVPNTPAEKIAIQNAVAAAVNYDAKRGDTISTSYLKFTAPTTTAPAGAATPAAGGSSTMIGYAKDLLVGLGVLIFLFFMRRMLRRRESEGFGAEPTWLRELDAPRPLAQLEADALEPAPPIKQLRPPINVARQQVEDLVDRDPDRVAAQVRAWMAED